ncbi:MAG: hypothetical protein JKY99_04570 [Rhizobiales bacterium]|nr:hypothetical protein [Hyphomicrobiales bacterium]
MFFNHSLLRIALLTLFMQVGTSAALAQSVGTVSMASRDFFVGPDPRPEEGQNGHLSLQRYQWIRQILRSDPFVMGQYFRIDERTDCCGFTYQLSAAREHYPVPTSALGRFDWEGYQITGYRAVGSPALLLVPASPNPDFFVWCSVKESAELTRMFRVCRLTASYPPDDRILLISQSAWLPPELDLPVYFQNLADRAREIIHCLDVTDIEIDDASAYQAYLLRETPELKGCDDAMPFAVATGAQQQDEG